MIQEGAITLYLDFNKAEKSGTNYTFPYDVYDAVRWASACWALNFESDLFTPVRVVKNNNYYRLSMTGATTSYYVLAASPFVVTTTEP